MVLNDADIIKELGKGLVPTVLQLPTDPYAKDSPVQPASLDLSVGTVYSPCTEEQNKPGDPIGTEQYILRPGRTAIVLTREELKMPSNLAAIGFPPSKEMSSQGILMTNPGQVDPGYEGPMRFTVINMGSKDFVLRKGDPIVSLVFLQLTANSAKDWLTRHSGQKSGGIIWDNLNRVSSDFVNVEERAREIANKAITDAELKIKRAGLLMSLLAVVIPLVINGILSFYGPGWKDPLQKVQQDIAVLQSQKDTTEISKQIKELQDQMKVLQQKNGH